MIANHIHDALGQVRKLQTLILEKRNFKGYSGTARISGGFVALIGAAILSSDYVPHTAISNTIGWAIVLVIAASLNYSALLLWFLFSKEVNRDWKKLLPAIDAIPSLVVGGIMSASFLMQGQYQLLFGTWMSLYGLSHLAYRQTLPKENYLVGLYYIGFGTFFLFKLFSFTNPWPMGIVFFMGEIAGGLVFYYNKKEQ